MPNVPFFYLAYRGWSHWRGECCVLQINYVISWTHQCAALSGSRHLVYLHEKGLLHPQSSPELEDFYSKRLISGRQEYGNEKSAVPSAEEDTEERLLLEESDGKELGEILGAPEIAIEVERAVVQIRQKLQSEQDASVQEKGTRGSNTSKEKKS